MARIACAGICAVVVAVFLTSQSYAFIWNSIQHSAIVPGRDAEGPLGSLRDAFVAIASVSAVLWTGGLIVMQIRKSSTSENSPQDVAVKLEAVALTRDLIVVHIGQSSTPEGLRGATVSVEMENIKGAIACIAFGMLAPLFMLFLQGLSVRVAAILFFLLYLPRTWGNVPIAIRASRKHDRDTSWAAAMLFLPTIAMLLVAALPQPIAVATCCMFIVFVGFFRLSVSVYKS